MPKPFELPAFRFSAACGQPPPDADDEQTEFSVVQSLLRVHGEQTGRCQNAARQAQWRDARRTEELVGGTTNVSTFHTGQHRAVRMRTGLAVVDVLAASAAQSGTYQWQLGPVPVDQACSVAGFLYEIHPDGPDALQYTGQMFHTNTPSVFGDVVQCDRGAVALFVSENVRAEMPFWRRSDGVRLPIKPRIRLPKPNADDLRRALRDELSAHTTRLVRTAPPTSGSPAAPTPTAEDLGRALREVLGGSAPADGFPASSSSSSASSSPSDPAADAPGRTPSSPAPPPPLPSSPAPPPPPSPSAPEAAPRKTRFCCGCTDGCGTGCPCRADYEDCRRCEIKAKCENNQSAASVPPKKVAASSSSSSTHL